jgi:hypothetical protein
MKEELARVAVLLSGNGEDAIGRAADEVEHLLEVLH